MNLLSDLFEGWKNGLPKNSEAMFSSLGGYWMFIPNEKVDSIVELIENANKVFLSNKYDEMELHHQAMLACSKSSIVEQSMQKNE